MAGCTIRQGWTAFSAILLLCLVLAGCKRQGESAQASDPNTAPGTSGAVSTPQDPLQQPFTEATVDPNFVPEDQERPADLTMTGKSVGKLYAEAVQTWDLVKFRTPQGRLISYTATIETEMGPIEIALMPEAAPNHVRNFIVLARIGYYDGLVFERIYHDQSDAVPGEKVELIEGGCPIGTGQPGLGSIGYWLKPEFKEDLHHEEGTVGACRDETEDSAACRFYIAVSKAPVLDGQRTIFGKVTRGIDVVRRISTQPASNTPEFPDGMRPENPIVIRRVTITAKEGSQALAQK
jgi:peptidyl-prolyl cis-trans isomerase B (cyclophilin B)